MTKILYTSCLLTTLLLASAAWAGFETSSEFINNTVLFHNFHEVIPDRIYRSGRMPAARLENVIRENGIRSVIDLRNGVGKRYPDGRTERELLQELGVSYANVSLGSSKPVGNYKLRRLLDIFRSSEEPVLIHCTQGIHRTGVATALWLLDQTDASFEEATQQLSFFYGYLQFVQDWKEFKDQSETVDGVLWKYERALPMSFQRWVKAYTSEQVLAHRSE